MSDHAQQNFNTYLGSGLILDLNLKKSLTIHLQLLVVPDIKPRITLIAATLRRQFRNVYFVLCLQLYP